jgi:hypothetical protein
MLSLARPPTAGSDQQEKQKQESLMAGPQTRNGKAERRRALFCSLAHGLIRKAETKKRGKRKQQNHKERNGDDHCFVGSLARSWPDQKHTDIFFFEMRDMSQSLHQNDVYGCFITLFRS